MIDIHQDLLLMHQVCNEVDYHSKNINFKHKNEFHSTVIYNKALIYMHSHNCVVLVLKCGFVRYTNLSYSNSYKTV